MLVPSITDYDLHITTQFIIYGHPQYNVINNSTKFKDQLKVEFVTLCRYMCIYITIPMSEEFRLNVII
jgi:hypothetical protein